MAQPIIGRGAQLCARTRKNPGYLIPIPEEVEAYLESLNQGLDESNWKIAWIRFAANDPKQNPIEDMG